MTQVAGPEAPLPAAPPPVRRRRRVLLAVTAALAVALVLLLPLAQMGRVSGPPTLDEVRVFEELSNGHTDDPVSYATTPPVGGPHDPGWLACGVYDEPVRDELAVHDLEHGTVWITHDPDLPENEVEALAAVLPDDGILSPHDDLPAPVVVTVWGRQLLLEGADDPRLALFVAAFGDGHTAPEPEASCAGGTTDADGEVATQV